MIDAILNAFERLFGVERNPGWEEVERVAVDNAAHQIHGIVEGLRQQHPRARSATLTQGTFRIDLDVEVR